MKHSSSRELFDYWNQRRGRRAVPDRGDIEPGPIRRILADTFILSFDEQAGHPFRIAGTRVCALFGHELKNDRFMDLWSAESRSLVHDLLTVVAKESVGVIASAAGTPVNGSSQEAIQELELLALPLSYHGRTDARILGTLAPNGVPQWLGAASLQRLTLGGLRYLGQGLDKPATVAAAQPEGRIRHGFMVYDGGQV
jgi:hypothetical protein